jgi:hypothetical protein
MKLCATAFRLASMAVTVLLVSAVTYTQAPSGLIATPSGSMPTASVATTRRAARSVIDAVPASSFAENSRRPSGLTTNCSGSLPASNRPVIFRLSTSIATTPSPAPFASLSVSLSATYSVRPSGLVLMPRGLEPTVIVSTTASVEPSMTVIVPLRSLLTKIRMETISPAIIL